MKTIRIGTHLHLTDPVSGQVRDARTGQVFALSAEALALISVFAQPREVGNDFEGLDELIKSEDPQAIKDFVLNLLEQGVLDDGTSTEEREKITAVNLSDMALVEKPSIPMLGLPIASIESEYSYDVALVGLPFDLGTTGYPGARFGPQRIRELSASGGEYRASFLDLSHEGWPAEGGKLLCKGMRIADVGDVIHQVGEPQQRFYDRVEIVADRIAQRGSVLVSIGGDHSCLYPLVRSAARDAEGKNIHLISFDAHTDLADYDDSICHNHGNVVSRLIAEGVVSRVTQIGLRGQAGKTPSSETYRAMYAEAGDTPTSICSRILSCGREAVYLTVDIDAVDPAFAPGTGTPVPMGMHPSVLLDCVRTIIQTRKVVGVDIVEYNPMRDVNDMTGNLVLHMLPRMLDAIGPRRD